MRLKSTVHALLAVGIMLGSYSAIGATPDSGQTKLSAAFLAQTENKLGSVVVNPYKLAPLTAVILDGGKSISDVKVTVQGKTKDGVPITYNVSKSALLTHGGVPVFGMYADFLNTVTVEYVFNGEKVKEDYYIRTAGIRVITQQNQVETMPTVTPVTVQKGFEDRLYFFNHIFFTPNNGQVKWSGPGGALEWDWESQNWISDTQGEVRWYMDTEQLHDPRNIGNMGAMMGFRQDADGKLIWVMSQSYMKYDLLGREIWNRPLSRKFSDASHAIWPTGKDTYLIRAAAADYLRRDGKHVHTVRDHILEVNQAGDVIDVWDLNAIMDPYRDNLLKALDQGAVCLNVDAEKKGETINPEDLEDKDAPFGDVTGVGPGRNWAHVNSIYYDEKDDSIIVSSRHQGIVKISRDKKVVWILASPEGWTGELASKVLTPVDAKGNPIKCENSKCEGDFDWSWTQHTVWGTPKGTITVFDNGDARGMEQPALSEMKYSRAVEYKVDETNMTVQQVWEYGKERGYDWYSPITSITEYREDRDTMFVYSATAGLYDPSGFVHPYLHEFKYGTTEPMVELKVQSNMKKMIGYQAMPINLDHAF